MQIAARNGMFVGGGGGPTPPAYWGLYFEAEEDGVTVTPQFNHISDLIGLKLLYSTDGESWSDFAYIGSQSWMDTSVTVTLAHAGDRVYVKAGPNGNRRLCVPDGGIRFILTGRCGAHGNIMSVLNADDENNVTITGAACFYRLFMNCTTLTSAPELPATTLTGACYGAMFYGCTALESAPVLPAESLANYCYQYMFTNCTALTSAPNLPAATLTDSCYHSMFSGCTSLVSGPVISATTLAANGMRNLFTGCSSLNSINVAFTTWVASSRWDFDGWVNGVSATGTFTCPTALGTDATIERGTNRCPSGWTVVNT